MQLSISACVSVPLSLTSGGSIHDSLLVLVSVLSALLPLRLCRGAVLLSDPAGSRGAPAPSAVAPPPGSFTSWMPLSSSSSHISNTEAGSIPFSTMVGLPSSRKLLSVGGPLQADLLSTFNDETISS